VIGVCVATKKAAMHGRTGTDELDGRRCVVCGLIEGTGVSGRKQQLRHGRTGQGDGTAVQRLSGDLLSVWRHAGRDEGVDAV